MQCPLKDISTPVTIRTSSSALKHIWMYSIVATGVITLLLLATQFPERNVLPPQPAGREDSAHAAIPPTPTGKRHDITILPGKDPFLATGQVDDKGNPIRIACATCHTTKPANVTARLGTPLTQFHQEVLGPHGQLSCVSCHNTSDGYASLRLADGRTVPYAESMTLCAQCHGTQYRDYQHGAHGGMTGYWDLTKGGRTRNTCTTCHNPHAPKYPVVIPAPRPHDRFSPRGPHE
jgi:hypothetical protein